VICRQCVLSDSFPGIGFDASGLCTICQAEPGPVESTRRRAKLRGELERVYREVRGPRDYDCIVAYSGGKDSTYTLMTLQRRFGLRCLAVTIDNGFVSERALANCRLVSDSLGIDHLLFRPSFAFMRRMYVDSLEVGVHVSAAAKRASAICNSCIGLINNYVLKLALQMEVPIVAGGYLGGQVPKDASLFEYRPAAMRRAREASQARYAARFGAEEAARFFGLGPFEQSEQTVYITNPMLVLEVSEDAVLAALRELGWERPTDTGRHSSNCRLNDLGIHFHLARHGFHPYVAEMAEQVRCGLMDRSEALERLAHRPAEVDLEPVARQIGLDLSGLKILP